MISIQQNLNAIVIRKAESARDRGVIARIKRANTEINVIVVKKHSHLGALMAGAPSSALLDKSVAVGPTTCGLIQLSINLDTFVAKSL